MAPRPVSAEHARQRKCRKAKAYRERIRQERQLHNRQADAQAESADCIDEYSQPIQESSIETPFSAYEASERVVARPTAAARVSILPDPTGSQFNVEGRESSIQRLGADVNRTGAPDPTCQYAAEIPGGSEQLSSQEQESSSTDPALIRREQTRLRVQRYRARQHQLRMGATTVTTDDTITPNSYAQDDGMFDLQNLTLDEVPQLSAPADRTPVASATSVGGENVESHPGDQADCSLPILGGDETSSSCEPDPDPNRSSGL